MAFADLFDFFDHVYIVNLKDRVDRREETIRELARIGVAVPSGRVEFFEATRPKDKGTFRKLGSLGNHISQTRVMEDALRNNYERILVCEDDLRLLDIDDEAIGRVLAGLQSDEWTMASLGYLEPKDTQIASRGLVPWDGRTLGCHMYAVRGEAIGAFQNYLTLVRSRPPGHPEGGSMSFDGTFNMARDFVPEVRFFIASPNLADQRPSRTNIHNLAFYDRIEPFRSIANLLRKLRSLTRSR